MSQDLLITAVTSRKSRIDPDNLAAAHAAMDALDDIELFSLAGGEDDVEILLEDVPDNELWYDDNEELTLAAWRDAGAIILNRLSEDLDDTAVLQVAGYYVFVAGGESSGDSPSRAYDTLCYALGLPRHILDILGLEADDAPVSSGVGDVDPALEAAIVDACDDAGSDEPTIFVPVGQIPGDDYADAIALTDGPALSAVFWSRDPAGKITQRPIGQI